MPKKGRVKSKYLHLAMGGTIQAYSVNVYEFELLEKIKEFERLDSQAEAIRQIIREAAKARGLHPAQQCVQPTDGTGSVKSGLLPADNVPVFNPNLGKTISG